MSDFRLYKGAWVDSKAPDEQTKLDDSEVKQLLRQGGFFVRNTYNFDTNKATSFWFVIKDSFGGMEELSSKMRNQVRKSLKTYDVKRIDVEEFRRIALPIFNGAQKSYRVKAELTTPAGIERIATACCKEFWAVYSKEGITPIAVAVNTIEGQSCNYNIMKCLPEYQHNSTYPYYGLIYEMNRHYLEERGLKYVNDGARSITEHSNIQPFLIDKFHFRRAYCEFSISYKWWVGIVVKILYPFKSIIPVPVISSLLNMEAMARGKM